MSQLSSERVIDVGQQARVEMAVLKGIQQPVEMEHLRACMLCGSDRFHAVLRVRRINPNRHLGPQFDICRCRDCGLAFTNPRPTRMSIGLFYEGYFDEYKHKQSDVYARRAREVTAAVTVGHKPRVLDVGCGTGSFLVEMQRLGWESIGVEPDPVACDFARKECGLSVHLGEVGAVAHEKLFDMVTLWHTLEHVHDARGTLELCRRLLKPNGVLIVEVPNFGSLQARCFGASWFALMVPEHIWHFSPQTLRRLIETSGFDVSQILPSFDRAGWGTSARLMLSDLKHKLKSSPTVLPSEPRPTGGESPPGQTVGPGMIDRLQEALNIAGHFAESRLLRYRFGTLAMRAICRRTN